MERDFIINHHRLVGGHDFRLIPSVGGCPRLPIPIPIGRWVSTTSDPSRVNGVVGGRLEFRDRMGRSLESRGRGPLEDVAPFDPVELESHLGLETSDLSTYQ